MRTNSIPQSLALLVTVFFSHFVLAQNDSLVLKNGNTIVGEIKSMERGVLQIETSYSDKDFMIELDGIKEIDSKARFLITTTDGTRYVGTIRTNSNKRIVIKDDKKGDIEVVLGNIVGINSLDQGFLSRINANIDFGYSLAKANDQEQVNVNFKMEYLAYRWSLDAYYNSLFSSQNDVENIRRNDGGIGYHFFLQKDWYLLTDLIFLANTEQNLELRSNFKAGLGKYVIHTNSAYWGFTAGAALNNESFSQVVSDDTSSYVPEDKKSVEGFLGTQLNLYNIGDLNLFTNLLVYPSFTEAGRWRVDYRFDAKYDDFLLKDFYIRAGYTLNYDNQPAVAGTEIDYVFTTGFGWEW